MPTPTQWIELHLVQVRTRKLPRTVTNRYTPQWICFERLRSTFWRKIEQLIDFHQSRSFELIMPQYCGWPVNCSVRIPPMIAYCNYVRVSKNPLQYWRRTYRVCKIENTTKPHIDASRGCATTWWHRWNSNKCQIPHYFNMWAYSLSTRGRVPQQCKAKSLKSRLQGRRRRQRGRLTTTPLPRTQVLWDQNTFSFIF